MGINARVALKYQGTVLLYVYLPYSPCKSEVANLKSKKWLVASFIIVV